MGVKLSPIVDRSMRGDATKIPAPLLSVQQLLGRWPANIPKGDDSEVLHG
jgi:hypothetical protein